MSQIGTQHSFDIGDGRIITLETGKLAKQADGAVVVRLGDTMILATIVSNKEAKSRSRMRCTLSTKSFRAALDQIFGCTASR